MTQSTLTRTPRLVLTANSERLYATSLGLEVSRCGASKKNGSIQKPGWHGAAARPRESNEPQQDASRVENSESNERLGKDYGRNCFRARVAAPRGRPNPTATNYRAVSGLGVPTRAPGPHGYDEFTRGLSPK